MTSTAVITAFKFQFARYGAPSVVMEEDDDDDERRRRQVTAEGLQRERCLRRKNETFLLEEASAWNLRNINAFILLLNCRAGKAEKAIF